MLQTSLDNYYVSYELNAYTHVPERMAMIYSELHQNIQDWFNEANVEIMSPGYTAYRNGDEVTIPATYRHHGPLWGCGYIPNQKKRREKTDQWIVPVKGTIHSGQKVIFSNLPLLSGMCREPEQQ